MHERLREELRKYAIVSAYLYVCFGALAIYKSAVLRGVGTDWLPHGLALAKALILGKFLLIGDAVHVGTRVGARSLLNRILNRSLLLLVLLVVLTIVEELIVGLVHHRPMGATVAELMGPALPEKLAGILLLLLVLLPFVAVTELNRALGPGGLRRLMLGEPPPGSRETPRQ